MDLLSSPSSRSFHCVSIAELLAKHHYHTQFIYGGEAHFDNMRSFFLGNGFQEIVDLPTFTNPNNLSIVTGQPPALLAGDAAAAGASEGRREPTP